MSDTQPRSPQVFVDADACPAKDEILLVCKRHGIVPIFVANAPLPAIKSNKDARMEVVTGEFDAADNWLVEQANESDLILTADLLLAQRAVKKKVDARRSIQEHLRQMNLPSHQPVPYGKQNRSNLKASLHQWIETRKRR